MSVIPSVIDCLFYLKKNRTYTTVEFKVWGYSSKCKARIENELKVDGIKKAKWNGDTKMLTAIFDLKLFHSNKSKHASVGYYIEKFIQQIKNSY